MLLKQYLIVFSSSILLSACATTDGESDLGEDLTGTGSDCISIRTIRDYESPDNLARPSRKGDRGR